MLDDAAPAGTIRKQHIARAVQQVTVVDDPATDDVDHPAPF
jgi:hypothetical protein